MPSVARNTSVVAGSEAHGPSEGELIIEHEHLQEDFLLVGIELFRLRNTPNSAIMCVRKSLDLFFGNIHTSKVSSIFADLH
jgi:hypothetical protein